MLRSLPSYSLIAHTLSFPKIRVVISWALTIGLIVVWTFPGTPRSADFAAKFSHALQLPSLVPSPTFLNLVLHTRGWDGSVAYLRSSLVSFL